MDQPSPSTSNSMHDTDPENSSLPVPLSDDQSQENLFGEVSSDSSGDDDVSSSEGDDGQTGNSIAQKTYLSHDEALMELLKGDQEQFLQGWAVDDIVGLLIQLTKHGHEEGGAKQIARNFRDTSVGEILECIDECKDINKKALEKRLRFQEMIKNQASSTNKAEDELKFPNWSSLMLQIKKCRSIGDESPDVISKFLSVCSGECERNHDDTPDYERIYSHLSSMAQGYAVRSMRGTDAAIIFDIFEQMKKDIKAVPGLTSFFKKMHEDVQSLPNNDWKLNDDITEEDAKFMTNVLDFPTDDNQLDIPSLLHPEPQ